VDCGEVDFAKYCARERQVYGEVRVVRLMGHIPSTPRANGESFGFICAVTDSASCYRLQWPSAEHRHLRATDRREPYENRGSDADSQH
jgi:hypothetical protein